MRHVCRQDVLRRAGVAPGGIAALELLASRALRATRIAKRSALWYRDVVRQNGLATVS